MCAWDYAGIKAADHYYTLALGYSMGVYKAWRLAYITTNDKFGWFKEGAD